MSKSVVVTSCNRIACAGQTTPTVVLCLDDESLLASGNVTIEGTLTNVYKTGNDCGCASWRYVVSYDEALLTDPSTALTSADVTGIFCKSCLTTWVEEIVSDASAGALPYGQSVLTRDFEVTSATYVDTGLTLSLPSAGTYLITTTLIWVGFGSEGSYGIMSFCLYNDTAAAIVPYSEDGMGEETSYYNDKHVCYHKSLLVTVAEASVINVQVKKIYGSGSAGYIAGGAGQIYSENVNNTSLVNYIKIA